MGNIIKHKKINGRISYLRANITIWIYTNSEDGGGGKGRIL